MTAACLEQKTMKYGFGRLIDLARAAQVAVSKHGRAVVVYCTRISGHKVGVKRPA